MRQAANLFGNVSANPPAPSKGMASAAKRVLHTEDILLNIFKHLDDDHWGDYFLVEKAWLPVITKHRCRDLRLSGLPWRGTHHDPRILEWRTESVRARLTSSPRCRPGLMSGLASHCRRQSTHDPRHLAF